jgi:hypothetical protein
MSTAYYLVKDGRATGPHSLAVLRQKADLRVIKPESLVCSLADAAAATSRGDSAPGWVAIASLPELHRQLFPARALPALGTAHFTDQNARTDAALAPTEVTALLRDNTARQGAAEAGELPRPPGSAYRYRRRRDYLWCAGSLNAFCFAYGAASTFLNPFLIALFVIGNLALLWVLFVVMDRY